MPVSFFSWTNWDQILQLRFYFHSHRFEAHLDQLKSEVVARQKVLVLGVKVLAVSCRLAILPLHCPGELRLPYHCGGVLGDAGPVGAGQVLFAMFSKVFAITEGLLPPKSILLKCTRFITLETGLIFGILLVLGGLGGSIYATRYWALSSYGPLDTQITLRFIVPSITAIILGLQTILGSFFLSVLGLQRKNNPVEEIR